MKFSRSTMRVLAASVVILVFGVGWFYHLRAAIHGRLEFDDAYMFQRYAWHVSSFRPSSLQSSDPHGVRLLLK